MKLTPCDISVLGINEEVKKSENQKILEAFIASGLPCCEVVEYSQKSAARAQTSLYSSAKRYFGGEVTVMRRGEKVYLVRKEALK